MTLQWYKHMRYEQQKKVHDGTELCPKDSALVASCYPTDPAGALGDRWVPRGYFAHGLVFRVY